MQFLTTLLLATSAMALPLVTLSSRTDSESCIAKGSEVTEWTIHDFDFHASFTKDSSKKQKAAGSVSFTLENPALSYKAKCHAKSDHADNFFYGNTDYDCDVPVKGEAASFTYHRKSGKLAITQSWSCRKEGGRFEAKGETKVKLDCNKSSWKHSDYKTDEKVTSQRKLTCEKKTFKAPITEISSVL
ncbi:hypothetical protein FZEAL_2894 [Fusarium zealandicum]|uniref:AA1-like domain-containing protein n=1 Tax=Fusarium zealandicum TaxID=1053134 RepID=A0A8H4UQL6_9HYPO|nr:hypothetical protein FZEAL_2894 [Fusarium zealandicum]